MGIINIVMKSQEINELVVEGPSQKKVAPDEPKKPFDTPKEPTREFTTNSHDFNVFAQCTRHALILGTTSPK